MKGSSCFHFNILFISSSLKTQCYAMYILVDMSKVFAIEFLIDPIDSQ